MKTAGKIILLVILFTYPIQSILAQANYSDDLALWIGLNLEKKINKKISLELSQQNRINENISTYGRGSVDLALTYKLIKGIRLMGSYTYLKRPNSDNSFTNEHRLSTALLLKKNIGHWDFSYRSMVQMRFKDIYSSKNGKTPKYYWRNKVGIKYKLNKYLSPYLTEEFYYPFNQTKINGFSKSRSVLGFDYTLNRKTQVGTYFLYQHELNAPKTTQRDFVFGLEFSYQL